MKNESVAISYCINIPEDATNGDVIMAMFPNARVECGREYESDVDVVWVYIGDIAHQTFTAEWWNAPYKRESEKV